MSIEHVKAIKTRWDAKSLVSSITGGIHHGRPPEQSDMPYCVFTELSNPVTNRTRGSRYYEFNVQFDVYASTGDPETSADLAESIKAAFCNAENASTNPLSASGLNVMDAEATGGIVTTPEGDEQVYRSSFPLRIRWSENRTLAPA